MLKAINSIMETMNTIEYGYLDDNGKNIISDIQKWDNEFHIFYKLLTPDELLKTKCGVCWDQVELERKFFRDINIKAKTYFIYIKDGDMLPSHTFLTFEYNNKHYWFEHSWYIYKGIHEYETEQDLLNSVKNNFLKEHNHIRDNSKLYLYDYNAPMSHITCDEFYKYIETQKLIIYEKL